MTEFPDTPAGRQFEAWLRAFNGDDRDAYQAFLQAAWPSFDEDFDSEWRFRESTGGFELRKVESSAPDKLVVLVQERDSDQFARFTLEVDEAPPHAIVRFGRTAIPRPPEFALERLSEGALIAALRDKLETEAAADRFSGAVLLAKDGKPVFAEAYGLADREQQLPNALDTRFRIGSMNKMFTATAILQLVQAGKLSLDDPVGKYLPDYPNPAVAGVTIAQLLSHTGGTGDIFGSEFDARRLELRTLQDYVELYGERGVAFEPGSQWAYSNYGFILLGRVIEEVSGEGYYDYVRKHVYEPAGMTSSGSAPEDEGVARRSIGYTKLGGDGAWLPNTDTLPYRGTSAGGGYSTVDDLLRFAIALQSHALLDAEHTALLTTGKVEAPMGNYAYGFVDESIDGTRCFGHGGGAPGMGGDLKICPESGYVIAVLGNVDPMAVGRIVQFITHRLPR